MPKRSSPFPGRKALLFLAGLLAVAVFNLRDASVIPSAAAEPPHPRLAVLVYFDQFRGDYLDRWDDLFADDGFHRMEREGAWFQNCHYPYAYTVTAAGHASVATGCSPETHGIVGNDWYDRKAGRSVNCVSSSDRYEQVPLAGSGPEAPGQSKKIGTVSPDRLLAPTIADALKDATGGKGRVVSLSFKDRSAVLPGGHHPDACYWFENGGMFVTSTYYRERLHPWVAAFNAGRPADRWYGKKWERLRADLKYERYSGPDDVAGEGSGYDEGRTFPHPLSGGLGKLKSSYYGAFYLSPFGNDLLLELAKQAISAEHLGQGDAPDLLTLSFSCNDAIGHCWGPDSQEVLDATLRSDLIVRDLLAYLDEHVGRGQYVVVVTADHGVCPLPEVSRSHAQEAARVSTAILGTKAEEFLTEKFPVKDGKGAWIEATAGSWIYLNRETIARRKLTTAQVETALASWLKKQPGIQDVITRAQLTQEVSSSPVAEMARRSFRPERSGDLFVIPKPYYLLSSPLGTGTTHGTPHSYDTHVPLLVYGPGVVPGPRQDAVTPQAAAAILARSLGIRPPAAAEASVPANLFQPSH